MIPLFKLSKLPSSQRLRKTAKIFEEAEARYLLKGHIPETERHYLAEVLSFWAKECQSVPLQQALITAGEALKQNINEKPSESVPETNAIRRALNTVHHLLRREIGQFPSEWDFDVSVPTGGLEPRKRRVFPGMEVFLEDIRSPFNVGAMFRTAESFGVEKLYLSPFCADPLHPRAQRTAMGCVSVLPWGRSGDIPGTVIFALETGGTKLEDFSFPKRGIMIAGSEELGVSPSALAAADASLGRVSIPIYGAKGSLNVSVAFGIAIHAWASALQI
jgi:TrmH family RNA methyltransferase